VTINRGDVPYRDDAQISRSLIQTERSLTNAIRELDERRSDQRTADKLRQRLDELLGTIYLIAENDGLWERIADATVHAPAEGHEIEVAKILDSSTLPYILTTWGYTNPPPPAAKELVEDTAAALTTALKLPKDRRAAVQEARGHLITFRMRVSRQIAPLSMPRHTSALHNIARHVGATARILIIPLGLVANRLLDERHPGVADDIGKIGRWIKPLVVTCLAARLREPALSAPSLAALSEKNVVAVRLHAAAEALQDWKLADFGRGPGLLLEQAQAHALRARALAAAQHGPNAKVTRAIDALYGQLKAAARRDSGHRDSLQVYAALNSALLSTYNSLPDPTRSSI